MRSAGAASTYPGSSSAAATSADRLRAGVLRRGETEDEAHALLDAAWEAGITTYDTADAYGGGRSESYLGSWLRSQGSDVRDRIVLTTKTFNPMSEGADSGLAPARIRRQSPPASSASASTRSTSISPTRWTTAYRCRRRSAPSRNSSPRGRSAPTGAATSTRLAGRGASPRQPGLGAELALSIGAGRRERRPPHRRARGARLHALQPLAGGWLTGKYRRDEEPPSGRG